jgi:hypothetical protein
LFKEKAQANRVVATLLEMDPWVLARDFHEQRNIIGIQKIDILVFKE